MASARTASLLARRDAYSPYGSSGRIRLLTPGNNAIASIAKQNANAQLDVMVKNYNAGLVSNKDFKDFLIKMQDNPGVSEVDKADIKIQIGDFDSRIQADDLTARYKAAPDGSVEQLQAAQALSTYYKGRASTQQQGTPAYGDNMNSAAAYDNKVLDIQKTIATKARANQRYVLEQEVNKIPSGTSANSQKKAEMWLELYNQANADGDVTAANQYAAYYEKELTNAGVQSEKEVKAANKKTISDFINTTLNDYHSGKISGDQAIAQLQQADQFASDTDDVSSQIRLQSLYQTISREVEKGVTYTANGGFGDKSKSGGTGGGEMYLNPDGSISYGGGTSTGSSKSTSTSGGKVATNQPGVKGGKAPVQQKFTNGNTEAKSFSQLDLEYKNAITEANKALVNGSIDANQYTKSIMLLAKSRQVDLQNITSGLNNILSVNPKAKYGSKQISTLAEEYTTELQNVTAEYNGIRSGNLVISMTDSTFTDPTGQTISKPKLGLVPKSSVAGGANVNGVWYTPKEEPLFFGNQKSAEKFLKDNGIKGTVVKNQSGGFSVVDEENAPVKGNVIRVTDTDGNSVAYQDEGGKYGYLPQEVGPRTYALRERIVKGKDTDPNYQSELMNYAGITKFDFKTPVGLTNQRKVAEPMMKIDPNIKPPETDIPQVVAPVSETAFEELRQIEANRNNPDFRPNMQTNGVGSGATFNPVAAPKLQIAGTPSQTNQNLVKALNPTGNTPIKVAAPPAGPTSAAKAAQVASKAPDPNQYSVGNSLKKLANTLSFGLLKF